MIINVDIDDTIYEMTEAFLGFVNRYKLPLAKYPTTYNYWTEWGISQQEWLEWLQQAVSLGSVVWRGRPTHGAWIGLVILGEAGHRIRLVTKRLEYAADRAHVIEGTLHWLQYNDMPYDDLAFIGHKGHVYAEIGLDDSPNNVREMMEMGTDAYLLDRPFNKDDREGLAVVADWREFIEIVTGTRAFAEPNEYLVEMPEDLQTNTHTSSLRVESVR